MKFRTRQAPSPTGYLHLGTTRQMLFSKLFAIVENGSWYLRIDDTDRKRLVPDAVTALLKPLSELGLLPDEGVVSIDQIENSQRNDFYGVYQTGQYGPYIQSERLDIYHEHAQNLIDKKLAYWTFFTEQEKEELLQIKSATGKAIDYFKETEKSHSFEEMFMSVQDGLADLRDCALRFRLKRDQILNYHDKLLGELQVDLNFEEDFFILKNDGFPSYHFAHLIDDHLMKTSLVIRSQEWLPSLARHWVMFQDYWGSVPEYIHLPFILGETGNKKMSKRDGNVDIRNYINQGFLPEAIINYLVFLGWNPGTEKEFYLSEKDF